MKHILRSITEEIEALQYTADLLHRKVDSVYLTTEELDEFADEMKTINMEDDPRKVGSHDFFRWKGTKIQSMNKYPRTN